MMSYLNNVIAKVRNANRYREEYQNEDGTTDYANDESLYIDNLDDILVEADEELRNEIGIISIPIHLEDGYYQGDASLDELKQIEEKGYCEIEYDEDGNLEYVYFKLLDDALAEKYEEKAIAAIEAAK